MIDEADVQAGLRRLERWIAAFDADLKEKLIGYANTQTAPQQPWLVAGVSDGIGLLTTLAAIDTGLLRRGIGIYWEPPHLLELQEDGTPVSAVHRARLQNAVAIQRFAAARGADFRVHSENVILAPQRDLKGRAKTAPGPLPDGLQRAWQPMAEGSEIADAIFLDSVAFGKWICPREGEEPITTPSIDFDGRILETKTKKYHARGYEETMDTMGRNHGLLLEELRQRGWLGPRSISLFLTWAGGSQNVDVLDGIYGRGALGDAKIIAESDIARFRLEHPTAYGAHAIVRLPAFLSAALMGIPGGGLFGLISRRVLEERGCFESMPTLALRTLEKTFGPAWIRENPISQLELDTAEVLYIEPIKAALFEAHRRIHEVWESTGSAKPISTAETATLLGDLLPEDHMEILARFRPTLHGAEPRTKEAEVETTEDGFRFRSQSHHFLTKAGQLKPDVILSSTLSRLATQVDPATQHLSVTESEFEVLLDPLDGGEDWQIDVSIEKAGDEILVRQRLLCDERLAAQGKIRLVPSSGALSSKAEDAELGTPVGFSMPLRSRLGHYYDGDATDALSLLDAPAILAFAQGQIAGVADFADRPVRWNAAFGVLPEPGDHVQTFAVFRPQEAIVTVVNQETIPLMRVEIGLASEAAASTKG